MTYEKIKGFDGAEEFAFPELRALSAVWQERKFELEQNGAYKEFLKKLQREWAIETGIIERLYNWDRGVTEALIEQGVESSIISHQGGVPQGQAEHIKSMIDDHLSVVEGLFGYVKGEDPLSEYFIRGLQAQFTAHQDHTEAVTAAGDIISVALLKGEYKKLPNNPRRADGVMHSYCPPELTKEEMEALIEMYRGAESHFEPEVRAAWLHHRFTQIHPFQDGNGRVARALASLVFLKDGLFPLVVRDSDREEYIGGLEAADDGDLRPLVNYFARRQREAILRALGLEQQVQQGNYAGQIISSALELLRDKLSKEKVKASAVYGYADKLFKVANEKFKELFSALDKELVSVTPPGKPKYHARVNAADNSSDQRHYFQKQIVSIANEQFDYFANFDNYRAWVRATIITEHEIDYVLSFHGYGFGESGILAVSAFTNLKAPKEGGGSESISLRPAATDLFQFNYVEQIDSTERRFAEWLESSIAIALAEWKRTL